MTVTYLRTTGLSRRPEPALDDGVTITVLVADAQFTFADALAASLAAWDGLDVLSCRPTSGVAALKAALDHTPDVALLDYWLPEIQGPALVHELQGRTPDTKVVHLGWFHSPTQVEESLAAGSVGFLPKSVPVAVVAEAVRRAAGGELPVFEERLARHVGAMTDHTDLVENLEERFSKLTAREFAVLQLLAGGATSLDIARSLAIAEATVRTHVQRILTKTEAGSQLRAVAMAREAGLVP